MRFAGQLKWQFLLIALWLILTCAMASWWMIYSFQQLDLLRSLNPAISQDVLRHHRMLRLEGLTFIVLLLAGGSALLYYVWREGVRHRQMRDFFSAFSHDIKTSLTSVRLQVEGLAEVSREEQREALLERLRKTTVKLDLQLENSLWLSQQEGSLYLEWVSLDEIIAQLRYHWPELQLSQLNSAALFVDRRLFSGILKNLIQNSVIHGEATRVELASEKVDDADVRVVVTDNGQGYAGDIQRLGHAPILSGSQNGTGIGLYLTCRLMGRMGGSITFSSNPGFTVAMVLKGKMA